VIENQRVWEKTIFLTHPLSEPSKIALSCRSGRDAAMTKKSGPPRIEKLSAAKQRRLDDLLEKNSEGTITPREKLKLEQLVAQAEQLIVANAKRVAKFSRSEGAPVAAVPVWIQPDLAGR
jgi:hypothetical protein